ncbi:hypothetical protein KPH14_008986 [Odynerus spinipes]|uniref:XRCC4 coiled-coil domain-containing protein n=1 Tax=Odynerus spinipes TaxID=1348599 RepID=A0AAD9VQF8_9HYME|nr:hypothetical protein KPH14_008986 [Odynerus spinipes]
MLDVTISQILNEVDQTEYVLYTEWTSTSFKIMLFKSSAVPLMGEMLDSDINYYSDEHSKSRDKYLEETKNAFSGKDTEIQYFLQDNKFEWRRNKKWILGKITVRSVSNVVVISETLYELLKRQQHLQEVLSKLRKENESLMDAKKELCVDIEEMIKIKTNMEKELYQKFMLILNAKKKKIRELQNLLKKKENGQKTIFDAPTDESEDSDMEEKNMKNRLNIKKRVQKRLSHESTDYSEDSDIDEQKSKIPLKKSKSTINDNFENEMKQTASTSKEMHETIPNDLRHVPVASLVSSSESECELELKIAESGMATTDVSHLDFEEESEEELFS